MNYIRDDSEDSDIEDGLMTHHNNIQVTTVSDLQNRLNDDKSLGEQRVDYLTLTKASTDVHTHIVTKVFQFTSGKAVIDVNPIPFDSKSSINGYVESASVELTHAMGPVSVTFAPHGKSTTSATVIGIDGKRETVSTVVCPMATKEFLPIVDVPETVDLLKVLEEDFQSSQLSAIKKDSNGDQLIVTVRGEQRAVLDCDSTLGKIFTKMNPNARCEFAINGTDLLVPMQTLSDAFKSASKARNTLDKDVRHISNSNLTFSFNVKPLIVTPNMIAGTCALTFTFNVRMLNSSDADSSRKYNNNGYDDDDDYSDYSD